MTKICIILEDLPNSNVDVQFHLQDNYPESVIMYTNAQMIAKEIENSLKMFMKQLNDKNHQTPLVI